MASWISPAPSFASITALTQIESCLKAVPENADIAAAAVQTTKTLFIFFSFRFPHVNLCRKKLRFHFCEPAHFFPSFFRFCYPVSADKEPVGIYPIRSTGIKRHKVFSVLDIKFFRLFRKCYEDLIHLIRECLI